MKLKILIINLLLVQWTTIFAQSDATLFGHVVDETGTHIPFVNLVIKDTVTNQFAKNTTLLTISVLYKRVESDCWLTNWKFNVY